VSLLSPSKDILFIEEHHYKTVRVGKSDEEASYHTAGSIHVGIDIVSRWCLR
jgi:hypothetical protein